METINDYLIEQVVNEKIRKAKIDIATKKQLEEEYAMQLEATRVAEERHKKSKEWKFSGEYFDDVLEECHTLKALDELLYNINKKIHRNKAMFNVPFEKLLNTVGEELDRRYSDNVNYRKIPVFHVVRENFPEYDDDGEFTMYSHVIHSGFKTKYPMKDFRFTPVSITYPFSMSKEYILSEEKINLLDCGAIGARSGEYENEDWQEIFWDLCREHLMDKVHDREHELKTIKYGQTFVDKTREILDRDF